MVYLECIGGPKEGDHIAISSGTTRINVPRPVFGSQKFITQIRRFRWLPFFKRTVVNYTHPSVIGFKHSYYEREGDLMIWKGDDE